MRLHPVAELNVSIKIRDNNFKMYEPSIISLLSLYIANNIS